MLSHGARKRREEAPRQKKSFPKARSSRRGSQRPAPPRPVPDATRGTGPGMGICHTCLCEGEGPLRLALAYTSLPEEEETQELAVAAVSRSTQGVPAPCASPGAHKGAKDTVAALAVVAGGQEGTERGRTWENLRECVICMEEFDENNPEMPVLCECGVNKTFFHYPCLLEWLAKEDNCPVCRKTLFFEEIGDAHA